MKALPIVNLKLNDNLIKFRSLKLTLMKNCALQTLFILCLLLGGNQIIFAQESKIFSLVKNGDFVGLKAFLDTSKIEPMNPNRNASGYTPLHVLIDNYVNYRKDLDGVDQKKHDAILEKSRSYSKCLDLLLAKKFLSLYRTPEGWTALQYAAVKGKWNPLASILNETGGGKEVDKNGNTLLHLSLLANPDDLVVGFHKKLVQGLAYSYGVLITSVNNDGQTPLAFYMSKPRCVSYPYGKPPTTTTVLPRCNGATESMLESFKDFDLKSLLTKDKSGKNAMDYMKLYNPWASSNLEFHIANMLPAQQEVAAHVKRHEEAVAAAEVGRSKRAAERERANQNANVPSPTNQNNGFKSTNLRDSFYNEYDYGFTFNTSTQKNEPLRKLSKKVAIEIDFRNLTIYYGNSYAKCKILDIMRNETGDTEYILQHPKVRTVGFTKSRSRALVMYHDNTNQGYSY